MERQTEYRTRLQQCPQKTSDYSVINLWAWRDVYQLEWAWDDNLVWIRQNVPERVYWAPIGPWMAIDWEKVFDTKILPKPWVFTRIPEELHRVWLMSLSEMMVFEDNRDHWDYIYSIQDLIELKGNKYHKKKNLLRQFQKYYQASYVRLTSEEIEKALTLQTEWCLWRDCEDSETLEAENRAIVNTFQDWSSLDNIIGAGLVDQDHMIAFTVAEPLDTETIVIHFEKGCPHYKGVYQAINQMFLEQTAHDYTYVNREQDLGDPGLRKAKESYYPLTYLAKYSGWMEEVS
jgi:hypothetical protein